MLLVISFFFINAFLPAFEEEEKEEKERRNYMQILYVKALSYCVDNQNHNFRNFNISLDYMKGLN